MKTPWNPDLPTPLPEYPRPQLQRDRWLNLNGLWEYAIQPQTEPQPNDYDGDILVPYPVESELSGVQKPLQPDETLWYRRSFHVPTDWQGQTILLHFGAVDFACTVWINDQQAGEHRGGYLPFTFDITPLLVQGDNEIRLSVTDPTDSEMQERGKQVLAPKGIWYTAVSGIWQTVWLEPVPAAFIESLKIIPDIDLSHVSIQVNASKQEIGSEYHCEIEVSYAGKRITACQSKPNQPVVIHLDDPLLWNPQTPHLYDLTIRLFNREEQIDQVSSYFAMRKFSLERDEGGYLRFAINNEPLFLYGPLDQGYFPDGLYTPPSEEAMLFDIQFTKEIGCNMIRKHIKVEPARWYYHCDRLGMMVWQDMPNGGLPDSPFQATLSLMFGFPRSDRKGLKRFGRTNADNRNFYRQQLKEMIDHLHNFPCIAVWVPFNESWGQFYAKEVSEWVKHYDPTRLVDHASGWFDQGAGDWVSKHIYVKKLKAPKHDLNRAFVLSEFGGYSQQAAGHLWKEDQKFGYRFYADKQTLTQAYIDLLKQQLIPLISKGLTAAIYTQTTDVEIEVNGYLTYDRKLEKMDKEELITVHRTLKL